MQTNIMISGTGGQGILAAADFLGEALFRNNFHVVATRSYGAEARGGAAGAQVVLSTDPIHHPHLIEPTSMIMMSQGAYAKYVPTLAPGGILLLDEGLVSLPADHRADIETHGMPATRIAEELGNNRAANTVMLGFWTAAIGAVSEAAMRQAVAESVPAKTVEVNMKAFDIGFRRGLEVAARDK